MPVSVVDAGQMTGQYGAVVMQPDGGLGIGEGMAQVGPAVADNLLLELVAAQDAETDVAPATGGSPAADDGQVSDVGPNVDVGLIDDSTVFIFGHSCFTG